MVSGRFAANINYGNYLCLHLIIKAGPLIPQSIHDKDDNELLQNFYADHDNKWLGILLPRYTLMLLGVCMKYLKNEEDAKDCVQQIFLKIINELHKYKVDHFKSWAYMIAKNHCLMKLRDKGKLSAELNEKIGPIISNEAEDKLNPDQKDYLLSKMENALSQLNEEQKRCIKLFYLEKKSYSEVAAATGFTMLQVKSHIQNGKRNLKLMIENN